MNRFAGRSNIRGVSLLEILVTVSIMAILSTLLFTGIAYYAVMASQEDLYRTLNDDLMLTMNRIRKDVHIAANIVPQVGQNYTSNTTLCMHVPQTDVNDNVIPDQFEYVVYKNAELGYGVIKEVYSATDSTPNEVTVLNDAILSLGFLFSGQTISYVTNLSTVRDVQIIMVASRETGLQGSNAGNVEMDTYLEEDMIETLLELGEPFINVRWYIDHVNANRLDVALAATTGGAALRNRRTLGVTTVAAPVMLSS